MGDAGAGRLVARPVTVTLALSMEGFTQAIAKLIQPTHRLAILIAVGPEGYRKHRRRCVVCNPACVSPPLKGGAEYRCRQLARQRRR